MAKYETLDGIAVKATEAEATNSDGVVHKIWKIEFPEGDVREIHDSAFADNFKEVK